MVVRPYVAGIVLSYAVLFSCNILPTSDATQRCSMN